MGNATFHRPWHRPKKPSTHAHMASTKTRSTTSAPAAASPYDPQQFWRVFVWLVFFANSIFLIWWCLDRYLAPRFLFLSVALLGLCGWLLRDLRRRPEAWRLDGLDALLLGWYGLHVASLGWAYSWSEGVFFAQKTLLLFGVYWLMRAGLRSSEAVIRPALARATVSLTWVTSAVLLIQIGLALGQSGLDNEALYASASGLSGNKGLASDFLFFLLIFNVLLKKEIPRKGIFWGNVALLLALIVVLQTRTVYLALALSGLWYVGARGVADAAFRPFFLKKILPLGVLAALALGGVLTKYGRGTSLAERLNPATYLESASANERRFVWYKTDLLCADHPWLGVGAGSWKIWLPSKSLQGAYRLQEKGIVFTRVHNDYLEVRAELGWVGVLWFVALFALAGWGVLWAFFQKKSDGTTRHDAACIGAGLLGYCVIQFFDFPRERIEMQVVLAFLVAWSAHVGRLFFEKTPHVALGHRVRWVLGVLCIGLIFNVLVGYHRVVGEIHNIRMARAYTTANYPVTINESRAARNRFYELTDVALPLQWFEGVALLKQKNSVAAIPVFEEALRLNPWSFQVLNNYATSLAAEKRYLEAIPLFEKAVGINPRYDEGKFNLAYSHYQLGNYPLALDWISRVDTIVNPRTDDERKKNKSILDNKATFEQTIQAKMK
jgi:O-antigen ligase